MDRRKKRRIDEGWTGHGLSCRLKKVDTTICLRFPLVLLWNTGDIFLFNCCFSNLEWRRGSAQRKFVLANHDRKNYRTERNLLLIFQGIDFARVVVLSPRSSLIKRGPESGYLAWIRWGWIIASSHLEGGCYFCCFSDWYLLNTACTNHQGHLRWH